MTGFYTHVLEEDGIRWRYKPNVIYTADIEGIEVHIRRVQGGTQWRLYVGANIPMGRQFYRSPEEARSTGTAIAREIKASATK